MTSATSLPQLPQRSVNSTGVAKGFEGDCKIDKGNANKGFS
jgi:hypothetical protein